MNIAVILAGGQGTRFGSKTPKQMLLLGKKPIISWSVDTFHNSKEIDKIIIVTAKNLIKELEVLFPKKAYPKINSFVIGGKERSDSSFNALNSEKFKDDDIIIFHDAARPFISNDIIQKLVIELKESDACGTYINTTDTIIIAKNNCIESIPERKLVFSAQTPQGFKYKVIYDAHQTNIKEKNLVTDDITLVFNSGIKISMIEGDKNNFKITTELDLKFAEFCMLNGKNV